MKNIAYNFLFLSGLLFSSEQGFAEVDNAILFETDFVAADQNIKDQYPVKICVGSLGYSAMEAKTQDDPYCRKQKTIDYEECMEKRAKRANFKLLVINKSIQVQPGEVIYLKRKRYSFVAGASGFQKDFSKESQTSFKLDTANYGGVALDAVKKCKGSKDL